MSMIKCDLCGKSQENHTDCCPHCGVSTLDLKHERQLAWVLTVSACLLTVLTLHFFA